MRLSLNARIIVPLQVSFHGPDFPDATPNERYAIGSQLPTNPNAPIHCRAPIALHRLRSHIDALNVRTLTVLNSRPLPPAFEPQRLQNTYGADVPHVPASNKCSPGCAHLSPSADHVWRRHFHISGESIDIPTPFNEQAIDMPQCRVA